MNLLKIYMTENGLNPTEIARQVTTRFPEKKLTQSLAYKHINGLSLPSIPHIVRYARTFDIDVGKLVESYYKD